MAIKVGQTVYTIYGSEGVVKSVTAKQVVVEASLFGDEATYELPEVSTSRARAWGPGRRSI